MADLITAVSRLLADPRELSIFETSPSHSATRLEVEPAETEAFCSLDAQELRWQADSLVDKRRHETQKHLPQTFSELGGRASELYSQYAFKNWPEGHQRHFDDAWRFAQFLREKHVTERDYAECHRVLFTKSSRKLSIRFLPSYLVRGTRRRALQILWKWNGEIKERTFFLAV